MALVLNAINPSIGGVLIRGEKGTGKSTAVRALARLLPEQQVVAGCRFGDNPNDRENLCMDCQARVQAGETLVTATRRMRVVELPINASEDRVVGTIDLEAALKEGSRRFEPGVLAEANRNILYVDEVNLLDDHIVDVLLDAAAMGVNVVEREGVSVMHPSRFILVGTMNPEEGELRPQLLDRFGLCVDVEGIRDLEQRVAIVEKRAAWEDNPTQFFADHKAAEEDVRDRIAEGISSMTPRSISPIAWPAARTSSRARSASERNVATSRASDRGALDRARGRRTPGRPGLLPRGAGGGGLRRGPRGRHRAHRAGRRHGLRPPRQVAALRQGRTEHRRRDHKSPRPKLGAVFTLPTWWGG